MPQVNMLGVSSQPTVFLTRLQNNLQHKMLQPRRVITLEMEMARCHYGGFFWRLSLHDIWQVEFIFA